MLFIYYEFFFFFFSGTCQSRVTSFISHYKARAISAYYVHVMLFSGSFVSYNISLCSILSILQDPIEVNFRKEI